MVSAIIFDDGKGQLAPLTDLRPAFDVRTGAMRTIERLKLHLKLDVRAMYVPRALKALAPDRHAVPVNTVPPSDKPYLLVNGRCPIPLEAIGELEPGQALRDEASGDLIAARVHADAAKKLLDPERDDPELDTTTVHERVLLSRPWHFRTVRDPAIAADMRILARRQSAPLPAHVAVIGDAADVVLDHRATVHPGVILDTTHGPIVISAEVTVRPGAILCGPCAIGPGSTVLDRCLVKPNTAIGPTCKIAGEVGGCVFQGFANKAHDGHLGDSWLGEWVNLGAGTTNSNLLNTYAEVPARATPEGRDERTGEQYLGCVLGDHVKTAICTRIMTGAIVHTGAMLAASAPVSGCVPAFTWGTDAGSRLYRFDKFMDVARSMMGRREQTPSQPYAERLEILHQDETLRRAASPAGKPANPNPRADA